MMRQGIDTRIYAAAEGTIGEQAWAGHEAMGPISVQFVSGSFAKSMQNVNMTKYARSTPNRILSQEGSQSSNISLHATSSLPFIDDNIPHNRIYASPIIAV